MLCFVASSLTFSLFLLTLLTFVSFAPHVCVTSKYSHKGHIFPSDVSSVSKTELPSVSARKSAPFLVHSVKRHRKSPLYCTRKYIRMRNRGLIRGRCKIFLHRGQIGFGAHQTSYVTDTTSLSPRSKAAGA
jgi:hypothetical protein